MNLVMQFRKVCNHPDLFERRDVRSPLFMQLEPLILPKLLFEDEVHKRNSARNKLLNHILNVFNCDNLRTSCYSYLTLVGLSYEEIYRIIFYGLIERWFHVTKYLDASCLKHHRLLWRESEVDRTPILVPLKTTKLTVNRLQSVDTYGLWSCLLFTWGSHVHPFYGFSKHMLHYKAESADHREMRLRKYNKQKESESNETSSEANKNLRNVANLRFAEVVHKARPPRILECEPTFLPKFLDVSISASNGLKAEAPSRDVYCCNMRILNRLAESKSGGSLAVHNLLTHGDNSNIHVPPHFHS